jgi:hypothetical protein
MKSPSGVSAFLQKIADEIDNSEQPSASLVKRKLKDLIYEISPYKRPCGEIAARIALLTTEENVKFKAREEFEGVVKDRLVEQNTGKSMRKIIWGKFKSGPELESSWIAAKSADTGALLERALKNVVDDASDFIKELHSQETERQKLHCSIKKEEEEGYIVTSAPPVWVPSRISALSQPLSERSDYGSDSNPSLPRGYDECVGKEECSCDECPHEKCSCLLTNN